MMNRLWVTGYRSFELGVFNQTDPKVQVIKYALKKRLIEKITTGELEWLISGGNLGTEQWALETALEVKKEYDLKIAMMVPYEDFEKNWQEDKQLTYQQLKNNVDFFATTSKHPYQNFMQIKNYQDFMINHTDEALLVYDLEHPGKTQYEYDLIEKYQNQNEYDLNLLDFYDLEDSGNELDELRENEKDY